MKRDAQYAIPGGDKIACERHQLENLAVVKVRFRVWTLDFFLDLDFGVWSFANVHV